MQNGKLNKLIKKANKIRIDAKAYVKPTIVENKEIKCKDFKLYHTLIDPGYHGHNFWFAFDILGISVFTISAWIALIGRNDSSWFLYFKITSIVGAIYFIFKLFILQSLIHILKYPSFKNWVKNNSFNIVGWDKTYNNDDLLLNTSWYKQYVITIHLTENCPQATKDLVNAAVIIFIKNANAIQNNYYDGLEKWQQNGMNLIGSSNNTTLGYTHRLIKNDLNLINKTYGGIISLNIEGSEQTTYVNLLPTDSSD